MKFGLFNLMSYQDNPGGVGGIISNTRDMISIAEQIGFDIAWFAEHHFTNYSISVSPLMLCAHFAGLTKKSAWGRVWLSFRFIIRCALHRRSAWSIN